MATGGTAASNNNCSAKHFQPDGGLKVWTTHEQSLVAGGLAGMVSDSCKVRVGDDLDSWKIRISTSTTAKVFLWMTTALWNCTQHCLLYFEVDLGGGTHLQS